MGFYGNITNTNKTQFTFDKTYSSRFEMEKNLAKDEVYLGRYVLVEYDINTRDTYQQCYAKNYGAEINLYSSNNYEEISILKWSANPEGKNAVTTGDIVYVAEELNNPNSALIFYKCINPKDSNEGVNAIFSPISTSESAYTNNYNIDMDAYGPGRGYDSTVWQKVYTQNSEKYVMIAELNSVVPTFDLSADAPTMEPITPHFDADSTNVYYKLHWQPQWGLRIAQADENENSDCTAQWEHVTYDPVTDISTTHTETVNAAINFNGPALEPQIGAQEIKKIDNSSNYITLLPTGQSGNEYNVHDGSNVKKVAKDIQELRVSLPVIGNTISKVWDIVHGPERNNSPADSLQGRLNFFTNEIRKNEIPVQHQNGYLVGAIMLGDEWISTEVNASDKTIKINHIFNGTASKTAGEMENSTPTFGDSFTIPYVEYDEMGHIKSHGSRTITIPKGSLVDNEESNNTANVLVGISFEDTDGKITTKHKNVGNLKLDDYKAKENADVTYIQESDTINTAFNKLDTRLDNEISRAKKAEADLVDNINSINYEDTAASGEIVYAVEQESGKISVEHKNVGELTLTNYIKPTTLSNTSINNAETLNTAIGKLEYRLEDEVKRAQQVENDINVRINEILDGVTEAELNTFKELSDALNDDGNFASTITTAIAAEKTAREEAINKLNQAPSASITNTQINQWNKAEENIQSDWEQTDETADDFIKNKPTNLVKTNDEFIYIPEEKDETGEIVSEAVKYTIEGLFTKVRELETYISTLENRISELEEFHTEETL